MQNQKWIVKYKVYTPRILSFHFDRGKALFVGETSIVCGYTIPELVHNKIAHTDNLLCWYTNERLFYIKLRPDIIISDFILEQTI